MRVWKHMVCWGVLLLLGRLQGQDASSLFYQYGIEEGLPSKTVFHALQDEEGYLWTATPAGLARMDAFAVKTFTVQQGLASNDVRYLYLDQQNRIWVLTGAGLSRSNPEKTRFERLDSLAFIGPDRILSISGDPQGNVWLTGPRSLFRVDSADQVQDFPFATLGLSARTRLLGTTPDGRIWLGDHQQLTTLENDKDPRLSVIPLRYPCPANAPLPIVLLQQDGSYFYNAPEGLVLGEKEGGQRLLIGADTLPKWGGLSGLQMDSEGGVWASFHDGGILWLLQHETGKWRSRYGLENLSMNHLLLDREQNIWISTQDDGFWQLSPGAATVLRNNQTQFQSFQSWLRQIPGDIVAMQRDPKGMLWLLMTDNTLYQVPDLLMEPRKRTVLRPEEALGKLGEVHDFLVLADQSVLLATEQGLARGTERNWQWIRGYRSPISLSPSQNGEIFLANQFNQVVQTSLDALNNEEAKLPVPAWNGLQVQQVIRTGNKIWFASAQGLQEVDTTGKIISWREIDPLFRAEIGDLALGKANRLWLATRGNGLVGLQEGEIRTFSKEDGLKSMVGTCLWVDTVEQIIWFGTDAGLGRIALSESKNPAYSIQWLGRKEGLASEKIKQVVAYQGYLLVLTTAGLTLLQQNGKPASGPPPEVFLRDLTVGDSVLSELPAQLQLPFDQNSLTFHLGALGFRYPGQLRFRYRLKGRSENWTETNQTEVKYLNMAPGNYTWEVLAVDRDQQESPYPVVVSFQIERPFYQSPPFLILVSLIGLTLAWLLSKLWTQHRQQQLLKQKVEEKTLALQTKVQELALANDDLSQFAFVASHDLKTPLRTIVNYLQLLERRYTGKLDEDADQFIQFAVTSSKQLYQLINDLLVYSELGRKDEQVESLDLNSVLTNVRNTLKPWMHERGAQLRSVELPTVPGVRTEWELLLRNLIENGIKFNTKGDPEVWIECKDSPGYWIISVADNGIGIPKEYQQKIFQLFQRLHTDEVPGSGLGLAMCKRIVENQGGNIWLESIPDQGTYVFFSVPKENHRPTKDH